MSETRVAGRQITEHERLILRHLNGEDVKGLVWGAAMTVSIEFLEGAGLVRQVRTDRGISYEITDAGREAIKA